MICTSFIQEMTEVNIRHSTPTTFALAGNSHSISTANDTINIDEQRIVSLTVGYLRHVLKEE